MKDREDDESWDGERWKAFATISDLRGKTSDDKRTRYRVVAQECFAMAVRELVRSATP